jgi:alpha-galactosidase
MVQPDAPGVATEHPDWLVRTSAGRPTLDRHGRYSLDASNPDARAWLHDLGARVRSWGVDMVKIDFLYLGAVEGERHDPTFTGTQALRSGLDAFVEGLGQEIYVLGCGLPVLPAVGICHGNRVGHDLAVPVRLREFGQPLASGWTGFAGIKAQARNVAARWALHHSWFDADPDVVMAWGGDGRTPDGYTTEESRTLATLAALCGGPFLLADDLGALDDTARGVLEHRGLLALALGHGDGFRPVDLFACVDAPRVGHVFEQPTALASTWTAVRDGRRVVARFNWTETETPCPPPDDLGPAHELWTGDAVGSGPVVVPAHGVRVFVADEAGTPVA